MARERFSRAQFLPDTRQIANGVIVNQGNWQATLEANKQAYFADFVTRQRFVDAYAAVTEKIKRPK